MSFSRSALPPRNLIALIIGITVVPLATLLWLGGRLLEQDRVLEGQQAQQRVERAADLVVAALQRALSSSQQRLAAGGDQWPDGTVAVSFREGRVEAHPKERVAYLPVVPALPEAPVTTFMEGEGLEFRKHDLIAAINVYRTLAQSSVPAIRAGALLRLGRDLSNTGRIEEALAAYTQLAGMDHVATGGAPAGLVGAFARCELLEKQKRAPELRAEAQRLASNLNSSRWALTEPLYRLYARDAARWTGVSSQELGPTEVFAEAIGVLWEKLPSSSPSGQQSVAIAGRNLAVLWLTSGGAFRALIAAPEFIESEWMPTARAAAKEQRVSFQLGDTGGEGGGAKAKRKSRDAALPWDISTVSLDPPGHDGNFVLRKRLLVAGFLLLVSMALTASYLIARAVSRELAVARLQSDFVATVSHEFRTPLTTLRQFTDRLREHRDLNEESRHVCYEAQSRATDRLVRLVESLLDFGRMEAGARRYRFEQRDCTELVRRVVEEFRGEAEAAGYQVEFHGNGSAQIDTDGEALARAVRNLLDNAVKYSPDDRRVEVELAHRKENILIAVRDYGIGIPAHEHAAIFSKFRRGEQARTRGIRGTGIGLAMVTEIVKAHYGRVEVESEPGKGSTFTIVLPAKR